MAAVIARAEVIAPCQTAMQAFVGDEGQVLLLEPSDGYQYM
jgi:hypothetical protein